VGVEKGWKGCVTANRCVFHRCRSRGPGAAAFEGPGVSVAAREPGAAAPHRRTYPFRQPGSARWSARRKTIAALVPSSTIRWRAFPPATFPTPVDAA